MQLEGTVYCEGPDCEVHQHVGPDTMEADRLPVGWVRVTEFGGSSDPQTAYCSWDCLMKAAAQIPPPERVGPGDGPGELDA